MTDCDYTRCLYEEEIPAWEWRRLLELSHEHDINQGGHYDGRLGAINFWCSPNDQPADPDWEEVEIRKFALNYPRSYVGAVYGEYLEAEGETDPDEWALQDAFGWGGMAQSDPEGISQLGGRVRLHWVMAPREKGEAIIGQSLFGGAYHEGKRVSAEDFATEADLAWCRVKFQELRSQVTRR